MNFLPGGILNCYQALAIAAAFLTASCTDEPQPVTATPPAEADIARSGKSWTTQSANSRLTLSQSPAGDGCRVELRAGAMVQWQRDACIADRSDFIFVSPDGDRTFAFYVVPDHGGNDWSEATVAALFVRGALERAFSGAEIMAAKQISDMSHEFSWVRGAQPGSGTPPRYGQGGHVVALDTIDGATLELGFDGSGVPKRPAPPAPKPQQPAVALPSATMDPEEGGTWSWEDREGGVHYTTWSDIPVRFRKRARRVTTSIGVIARERSSPEVYRTNSYFPNPTAPPRRPSATDEEEKRKAGERRKYDQEMASRTPTVVGCSSNCTFLPTRDPDPMPKSTPTCRPQGQPCTIPPDCCSGSCSSSKFICD